MAHNFYCKDDDHVVAHSHVTGPNEECLEEEKYVDFYLCLHKLNVCEFHSLLQTINFLISLSLQRQERQLANYTKPHLPSKIYRLMFHGFLNLEVFMWETEL